MRISKIVKRNCYSRAKILRCNWLRNLIRRSYLNIPMSSTVCPSNAFIILPEETIGPVIFGLLSGRGIGGQLKAETQLVDRTMKLSVIIINL